MTRIETGPTAGVALALGLSAVDEAAVLRRRYPISGWRSWQFRHGRLRSITRSAWWPKREALMAACPAHGVPTFGCRCGIHARSGRLGLDEAPYVRDMPAPGRVVLFGAAWLWGQVIEHEQGWRAQYAYPRAIWAITDRIGEAIGRVITNSLREAYGVQARTITLEHFNRDALRDLANDGILWALPELQGESAA